MCWKSHWLFLPITERLEGKVGAYGTGKSADRVRDYDEEADTMEVVSVCGLREN